MRKYIKEKIKKAAFIGVWTLVVGAVYIYVAKDSLKDSEKE